MSALDEIKKRAEGHTEGPWETITSGPLFGDHWYVCANDEAIAHISANDGIDKEQRGPNAELMAAAPKLLAALEAVQEAADAEVQKQRKETERQWARLKSRHPDSDYKTADRQEASAAGAERVANLIRRAIEEALR